MNVYFKRLRRILTCNVDSLSPEEATELKEIIAKKEKEHAKAKTKPRSTTGDSGAAA